MRTLITIFALVIALSAPSFAQCYQGDLDWPSSAVGDAFGGALARDGDTLAVGVPHSDVAGLQAGAVAMYERVAGVWTLTQELLASDAAATAHFGESIALAGDRMVIGSPGAASMGAVYVFERTAGTWAEVTRLVPAKLALSDRFGRAVNLDGDRLVSSAPRRDRKGVSGVGSVFVFELVSGTWTETAELTSSTPSTEGNFGWSADLKGGRLLVGAKGEDVSGVSSGALHLLELTGNGWSETALLSGAPAGAALGFSSIFAGNFVLGGAVRTDGACPSDVNCDSGSVFVYEWDAGAWPLVAELTSSERVKNGHFGISLSLDGNQLLVGALGQHPGGIPAAGQAYLFERHVDGWVEHFALNAPQPVAFENFGVNTLLAGSEILVVADAPFGPGAARVLEFSLEGPLGTNYCQAVVNSTGDRAAIGVTGLDSVSENCLTLYTFHLPQETMGYFLGSLAPGFVQNPGGSQGNLCLGGPIARFARDLRTSGASGSISIPVDLTDLPPPFGAVQAGETWYFQAWYRDKNPGNTSNFSDGLEVMFH